MSVFGMGVQQSRSTSDCSDSTLKPLELHRQAETGVFSDSESDVSDSDSDTDEETGVWMALPSALSSTGRTFRRIETQVVNNEEQLQLVKRRARKLARTTADAAESGADPVSPRDFHKIKVIGVGGMGRVLLVRHRRDGKLYAMKVVSKKSVKEKDMAAKVLSERDTKDNLYFVMEYCPGGELSTHLERATRFTEEVAAFYAAELLLAVQQLHQHGILHRDLKPENILLTEDGHLKLVDFGISKFGITEATYGATTLCGSYEYLAPEILKGKEYGTAADCQNAKDMCKQVLYTPLSFPDLISLEAEDLMRKLLNRNPYERLGSLHGGSEIKEHAFFRHIDWEMITFREVQPLIQPCPSQETIIDGSNFRDEFTKVSLGSIDSPVGGGGFSESFKGFNFKASEDQQLEYGYSRDAQ
ncbi:hypothetical protein JG688_00001291 [Phytophthora aleatoria]|uniref:AGC protein kinase n=1 Tax=Phytophthora aleatoria TaxID=2496075 RepID=A0A8J5J3Q9_9STRA|nr:hypothetical protein JG688_00001291 [Phytophthora aleatoria]